MEKSLAQRIQTLEDVQEIKNLKAAYGLAVDCGWDGLEPDGDKIAALVASDAIWSIPGMMALEGREAIREFFKGHPFPFGFHLLGDPLIQVNGDKASGTWHMLCPSIDAAGESKWVGVCYVDEFIRTSDGWRFSDIKLEMAFSSNNLQGWDYRLAAGANN